MVNTLYPPHPALAPFVKNYLVQKINVTEELQCVVTCKAVAGLVFIFKAPAITTFHFNGMPLEDTVLLSDTPAMIGPATTFATAIFTEPLQKLIIILQPTGTHFFLKEKESSTLLYNQVLKMDLITKRFREAQEKLLTVSQEKEAIRLLEPYLIQYFYANARSFRQKDLSVITHYIDQHHGLVTIDELAKHFCISPRSLERHFQTQVGMSPKAYTRAVRFRSMLQHLYVSPNPSWMDVVAQFNYTDQSHLIKDFYQYTGNSPLVHFQNTPLMDQLIHQTFYPTF